MRQRIADAIRARILYWRTIPWRSILYITAPMYALIALLVLVRDEFKLSSIRLIDILPHWPLIGWVALGLGILLLASLEGSFGLSREAGKAHGERVSELGKELATLKRELSEERAAQALEQKDRVDHTEPTWEQKQRRELVRNQFAELVRTGNELLNQLESVLPNGISSVPTVPTDRLRIVAYEWAKDVEAALAATFDQLAVARFQNISGIPPRVDSFIVTAFMNVHRKEIREFVYNRLYRLEGIISGEWPMPPAATCR